MRTHFLAALGAAALTVGAILVAPVQAGETDPADLPQNAGEWSNYGRDWNEQRFSPLTQVNDQNVKQLGLAWFADLAEKGGSYETTPLVVDGRIFVTSPWSKVYAFDARTGKRLWKYDPKVPGAFAVKLCCGIVNRGAGYWKGKVIWGTLDGRLLAVDAKTGHKVWEVQATDPAKWQSITGAPRVADGRVFIGEAGSEFEQRGYLSAFDASTGKRLWRWFVVPGDPSKPYEQPELAMAARTWAPDFWKQGGGGTPWDGILYDAETGNVLIGTGNGADWPSEVRSPGGGDNLFTASVVAINARTGKYAWHYQETPAESFDFDSTAQLTAADLVIDGEKRHVIMHAPKNGVFYVLDAKTGKAISADLFIPSANWLTGFDAEHHAILNPEANYGKTGKGWQLIGFQSHVWYPMAFSPVTGYMYLPTSYGTFGYVAKAGEKMGNQMLSIDITARPQGAPQEMKPGPRAYLQAWDPVNRKPAWIQPEGSARAGTMATAGNLVFQGGNKNTFNAFRADTGALVWSAETQATVAGGPASYAIDGTQYIAVVAGGGGGFGIPDAYHAPNYSRLLVYKLGGTVQLPPKEAYTPPVLNPPPEFGTPEQVALGDKQYVAHCAGCHGNNDANGRAVSSLFPDLHYSGQLWTADGFKAVVLGGALKDNGMVSFAKDLTPADAEAIRAYLVHKTNDLKLHPPPPFVFPGGPPPAAAAAHGAAPSAPAAPPPPALHQ